MANKQRELENVMTGPRTAYRVSGITTQPDLEKWRQTNELWNDNFQDPVTAINSKNNFYKPTGEDALQSARIAQQNDAETRKVAYAPKSQR